MIEDGIATAAITVDRQDRIVLGDRFAPGFDLGTIAGGEGLYDHQAAARAVEGEVGGREACLDEEGGDGLSEGLAQRAEAGGVGGVIEA